MSAGAWPTIVGLTVFTVAIKAVGPMVLGGRQLPALVLRVVELLAPAILAALIVVGTFTDTDGSIVIDARAGGLAAAIAVLAYNRHALVLSGVAATVTAALLRLVG